MSDALYITGEESVEQVALRARRLALETAMRITSETQLELIGQLKPTVWLGMASYGLHLANLAEAKGLDLKSSSVGSLRIASLIRTSSACSALI